MSIQPSDDIDFDSEVPVLIVGAGAAGLCAALAASEAGIEPVVLERDPVPSGSTALSAGLIPAAGTRFQAARGVADNAALFARPALDNVALAEITRARPSVPAALLNPALWPRPAA